MFATTAHVHVASRDGGPHSVCIDVELIEHNHTHHNHNHNNDGVTRQQP